MLNLYDYIQKEENIINSSLINQSMNRSVITNQKSPNKNNHSENKLTYNFLKDPHLIYYLQSPVRVQQLLESGLYQLDGENIIELETLETLKIA